MYTCYVAQNGDRKCRPLYGVCPTLDERSTMRLITHGLDLFYFDFDKRVWGKAVEQNGVTVGTDLKPLLW